MVNTYTSDWIRVSHGDITTHNPQDLVGGGNEITISNAEIQWQGVNVEKNSISTYYVGDSATGETTVDKDFTLTVQSPDSGTYDYVEYWFRAWREISSNPIEIEWTVETDWGVVDSGTWVYDDYQNTDDAEVFDYLESNNVIGQNVYVTFDIITGYNRSDKVEYDIQVRTQSSATFTTTYKTDSPRVTRDVSADSNSGELNDGETTNWISLDGFKSSGDQEFYHDIDGSDEAYFRFRFDWEYAFPTALKQLRIKDTNDNTTHKVALADPSDSQLDYNSFRTSVGGTTYAIDVVDPSDRSAIETHRMYHPTDGIVCPRSYDTV